MCITISRIYNKNSSKLVHFICEIYIYFFRNRLHALSLLHPIYSNINCTHSLKNINSTISQPFNFVCTCFATTLSDSRMRTDLNVSTNCITKDLCVEVSNITIQFLMTSICLTILDCLAILCCQQDKVAEFLLHWSIISLLHIYFLKSFSFV